jgi:hypothetical protein
MVTDALVTSGGQVHGAVAAIGREVNRFGKEALSRLNVLMQERYGTNLCVANVTHRADADELFLLRRPATFEASPDAVDNCLTALPRTKPGGGLLELPASTARHWRDPRSLPVTRRDAH